LEGAAAYAYKAYRSALAEELRAHPESKAVLVQCCHCGIEFVTDPRNRNRTDLRCPFGCREMHAREASKRRSTAYNRSKVGQYKKSLRNRTAYVRRRVALEGASSSAPEETKAPRFRGGLLAYLSSLVRLIHGVQVSAREIGELLAAEFRQRSMALLGRGAYVSLNARDGP
jgi:hypothetical protein